MHLFTPNFTDGHGKVEAVSHDGVTTHFEITFATIVAFATGCPSEPPVGFRPMPSIRFQTTSPYPRANTCTNTVHLPIQQPLLPFEKFVYYVTSGILNTAGFGRV